MAQMFHLVDVHQGEDVVFCEAAANLRDFIHALVNYAQDSGYLPLVRMAAEMRVFSMSDDEWLELVWLVRLVWQAESREFDPREALIVIASGDGFAPG